MGKRKLATQEQKINFSGILAERFSDEAVEISPCEIDIAAGIDHRTDHVVSICYRGDDASGKLDKLIALAQQEITAENLRAYLHACKYGIKKEDELQTLELNLYFRLKRSEKSLGGK